MRHWAQAGAVAALIAALSILACSTETPSPVPTRSEPPTELPPTKTIPPTLTPTATPEPTPVISPLPKGIIGGSLTVAGSAGFPHRDVHQSVQESLTSMGPGIVYSRLLRLKTSPDGPQPNLLIECDLCQSWKLTEDLAYEFQLRPKARWQDIPPVNGRAVTAEDLVFSYQRLATPDWPNASLLSAFGVVEATAVGSLRLGLSTPDADALLSLADGHAKVVAAETEEQFGDLKESPVIGTGPWLWLETSDEGDSRFSRNRDYFERGAPFLDELVMKVVRDGQGAKFPGEGRLTAFAAGQVDVVDLPPQAWQKLEQHGAEFDSHVSLQGGSGAVLSFNVQDPLFADAKVRRGVFRAIDPWDYVDTLWSGGGFPGVGMPVSEAAQLLGKDQLRGGYFADPSMARTLLEDDEITGRRKIQLTVWSGPGAQIYANLGERIADDLEAVGLDATVRRLNPDQYHQTVMGPNRDYQIALGVLPPTSTTNSFLLALMHSKGRWNLANHDDGELDSMIEAQAVDFDPDSRRERLERIQRHILEQAYVISPVSGATRWAFRRNLKGFHPNAALSEYIHWSRVWLEP